MAARLKYHDKLKLDYERTHDFDHFFEVDEETRALYEEKYPLTRKTIYRHFLSRASQSMTQGYSHILLPTLLPYLFVFLFCLFILKMDNPTRHLVHPKVFPFFCVLWFLPMVLAVVCSLVKNHSNLERAYICGMLLGICVCIIYFVLLIHIINLEEQVVAGAASNKADFAPGIALALIVSSGVCFLLFFLLGPVSLARKKAKEECTELDEKA